MRLLIHDFAGHPFQIQLSRALARRGHTVAHAWCASLTTTPQGALERRDDDPDTLDLVPIRLDQPIAKQAFVTRWRQERTYGRRIASFVRDFAPDAVLSGNTPLDAQATLLRASRREGARFVFWAQDLIGIAAARLLREKVPVAGRWIGAYYERMEQQLLRQSDAVVLIAEAFCAAMPEGVTDERVHVIPNWAPLDAMPVRPRDNAWAREQGLTDRVRLLYSGTLGMKHDPNLLLQLARACPSADVIVVSQGAGADWLGERAADVPNLRLLPFQPFDRLPDVLGAADVLLAVLEPEAGGFSVPSKVLTNLCAGRPALLSVPLDNLAARIVKKEMAGLVARPGDHTAFVRAAQALLDDAEARESMGQNARRYAERTFDIERIADAFEAALRRG